MARDKKKATSIMLSVSDREIIERLRKSMGDVPMVDVIRAGLRALEREELRSV